MPWSPQPQIMARTKASHIRLPAEPAEHRVVAGTLTNRRRMGQEARRLERTFGPSRFNHLRRPATPPPEWHIDGEGTPPPVRYGRPRRAKRAPAPAPAPVPTGDSGHLVLPDDCVWPPPDSFREKAQTGGRPRPRADKFVAKSIVRNNGGALRHVEPELKGDRDVVLAAVRNSGRALEHASPSLRNDAAVVKVAVTQDATALRLRVAQAPVRPRRGRDGDGVAGLALRLGRQSKAVADEVVVHGIPRAALAESKGPRAVAASEGAGRRAAGVGGLGGIRGRGRAWLSLPWAASP